LRETLRPLWVTWGQRRWEGTVRVFEDYGTRNLPETLALADAVRFQESLGSDEKERRLVRTWSRMRERVEAVPGLEWRSPERWERGASLVAVRVRGRPAAELGAALYAGHGVVVRAFGGGSLDHLRVSPNVMTTDAEMDRFFERLETEARP
ncbi:MAG TPA: aminotransferase class V-fold PLP-dependent enzyme, partial [Longimicrobiales bacterium]|nr:aminotransferase class V-fold PLP-dependent enzyme [Longimicrobiales bacterium]